MPIKKPITLFIILIIFSSLTSACTFKNNDLKSSATRENQNIQADLEKISDQKIAVILYRLDELDFFNKSLSSDDLILMYNFLPQYFFQETTAQKALIAPTASDFTANMERIRSAGFSALIYDASSETMENPANKNRNVINDLAYLQQYRTALSYQIGVIANQDLLENNSNNLVSLVDFIIIQSESWQAQSDPIFKNYISSWSEKLKKDHPALKIMAQIATEPKGENMAVKKVASDEMIKTIAEVSDKIDGVIISYSPDTVSVLREFVQKVRGK